MDPKKNPPGVPEKETPGFLRSLGKRFTAPSQEVHPFLFAICEYSGFIARTKFCNWPFLLTGSSLDVGKMIFSFIGGRSGGEWVQGGRTLASLVMIIMNFLGFIRIREGFVRVRRSG